MATTFTNSTRGNDMTTTTMQSAPSRTPLVASLGFVASAVLTAIGTFGDETENHKIGEYLVTLGIAAAIAAIVFGLVVRTAAVGRPGVRSAVLGALAVVSLIVFWAGAPCVLASGAVATALLERDVAGRLGNGGKAGLALACLTAAAAVVLAIVG